MLKLFQPLLLRKAVKEAFDNLPCGICYFNRHGILVLCNRQMHRLAFELMGHDLQSWPELAQTLGLDVALNSGTAAPEQLTRQLSDSSWWSIKIQSLQSSRQERYLEVTAFDVSQLYAQQLLLRQAGEAQSQTIATLERIQENILSITREEEILNMKMALHNDFGYNLQRMRLFYNQGCRDEDLSTFLADQRKTLAKLQDELGHSDEIDAFTDLARLAKTLKMHIQVDGDLPAAMHQRDLLAAAVRECLTNVVRHAEGNSIYLKLQYEPDELVAEITNNGKPPQKEIVEGGGLSSLRNHVESQGGSLQLQSFPRFRLEIHLPNERGLL